MPQFHQKVCLRFCGVTESLEQPEGEFQSLDSLIQGQNLKVVICLHYPHVFGTEPPENIVQLFHKEPGERVQTLLT